MKMNMTEDQYICEVESIIEDFAFERLTFEEASKQLIVLGHVQHEASQLLKEAVA
jgi:hypothetical protein